MAAVAAFGLLGPTSLRAAEAGARLTVVPTQFKLQGRDSRQQLLATLHTVSGGERDATSTAEYRSSSPTIAAVDAQGIVTPIGSGTATIEVRHGKLNTSVTVEVCDGERNLPLDYRRDISPIFTKAGCNGGNCHGKSGGRGGFQLSLFGFDPRGDYDSIVKAGRGRKLSPAAPESSLFLAKPAGQVPHGGGIRLTVGDIEHRRLVRWIATGAPWSDRATAEVIGSDTASPATTLTHIEIAPPLRALGHNERQRLIVTAVYGDGSRRDVTRTTEFRSNDTAVAEVDSAGLVTTRERLGETAVTAIYQGQVGVCRILVPLVDPSAPKPELIAANLVDEHVLSKLKQLGIPPSPAADDATFFRRASLQIAGDVPTVAELEAYASDASPDKRRRLVERLLASGAHADFFTQKWCDILRIKRRNERERLPATIAFHRWFRNAWAVNRPYDRIVRGIVTATGSPTENPTAQWYHEVRALDSYVDDTAQVFLGVRITCARCHNHPFENFTQDDYFGLAAFFARVERQGGTGIAERKVNETIFVKGTGEVRHPVTNAVVAPHGLRGPALEIAPYEDPRHDLVDWMREPNNPYFARAFVNRMWGHFFGRGLVEPLDDLRVTNPASNEPLLDALAADFVNSGYDIRRLLTTLCTSNTYALSSDANQWNLADVQFNSRFYPQRLPAEVLLDAVDKVTGVRSEFPGLPNTARAINLPDEGVDHPLLRLFGKPPRESACECERIAEPSLGQSLYLMNDPSFLGKLANGKGLAAQLDSGKESDDAKIRRLFLTVLSRQPTPTELNAARVHVEAEGKAKAPYRNLLWALMNTKEFLYVR